jgi:Reverse transcriptase (RNA-dependent DNA polymerase)/Endonuclease-reverse transcriptase
MEPHKQLINIAYWNAQGIQHKIHELYNFLKDNHIHVACVNETLLNVGQKLYTHPNFTTHRLDRDTRGGGVAIIIKNNIKHKLLPHTKTTLIENISIEIFQNNKSVIVTSIYVPGSISAAQSSTHFKNDIRKLTSHSKSFYICGDFNAKHRDWNNFRANKNGNLLYDAYCEHNFLIKYPSEFTRFPNDRRSNPSTIDLVLTNGLQATSEFKCHPMSSDHVAITFSIHSKDKTETFNEKAKHNYKLADWDTYRCIIQYHLNAHPEINTIQDIEDNIDKLTRIIEHARDRAIPKTYTNKFELIIPDDIKHLIARKNTLRRWWQQTRDASTKTLINFLESDIKTKINELRNDSWQDKLQNIHPNNQAVWQTARLFKTSSKAMPPLKHDEKIILSPIEKAEILGIEFHANHNNPLMCNNPQFTSEVNQVVDNSSHNITDINTINFTDEDELTHIIKKLKNKKAPGVDGINNNLLKKLPLRGIQRIVTIINGCLKLSYFPERWKYAKVIAIPKPGKEASNPHSYRPISLLCSLSKLLERVILSRINDHLEEHEILPPEQHGFRTKFSTTKQLHKLITTAKTGLTNKQSTGIIMLDVEKAFDRVWHNGLIFKLISLRFPQYIIKIVTEFLNNRQFQVDVKGHKSRVFNISAGVPQGAVLSPTLYNIYTHDIPKNANTKLSLFADDTAFYATSAKLNNVLKPLREHATQIHNYMNLWKISISQNKTQAIYITKRQTQEIPKNTFTIFGKKIKWTSEAKYLGLILDKRLTMKQHTNYVIQRANVAMSTLYPLISRKSKMHIHNKMLIYKLAIRPVFTYACPAYKHIIAKTHVKRLQITQNKALRQIFNTNRYERLIDLHEMAKVPTVEEYLVKLTDKFTRSLD